MSTLDFPCPVCRQKALQPCVNTISPGDPLPGRRVHFARLLPPDSRKPEPEDAVEPSESSVEPRNPPPRRERSKPTSWADVRRHQARAKARKEREQ